jgi:hypothetical protein
MSSRYFAGKDAAMRRRRVTGSICTAALLAFTGCSICAPGFIDDYATVGGKWERADPTYGRVGSPFSDPGSAADGHYASAHAYEVEPYDSNFYDEQGMDSGAMIEGPIESYPNDDGIEIVPQYEGDSIILGEEW